MAVIYSSIITQLVEDEKLSSFFFLRIPAGTLEKEQNKNKRKTKTNSGMKRSTSASYNIFVCSDGRPDLSDSRVCFVLLHWRGRQGETKPPNLEFSSGNTLCVSVSVLGLIRRLQLWIPPPPPSPLRLRNHNKKRNSSLHLRFLGNEKKRRKWE